jgi:hypothetical protein
MTSPSNADPTTVVSPLAATDRVVVAGVRGFSAGDGVGFDPPASP